MFLIMIAYRSIKISSEQTKLRLNDIFQVVACIIIPGLSTVIFVRIIFQVWYLVPYENIFLELMPEIFCTGLLVLTAGIVIVQMLGARAGNQEKSMAITL